MDDAIGKAISQLPAQSLKLLPKDLKAALKKYGSWAKIPADQRKVLARKFADPNTWDMQAAMSGVDDALSPAPAAADPPPDKGVSADGWVTSREFAPPGKFDPKQLDADKYLPFALAEAKKMVPDAVLFRIDATGVTPNGRADITAVDNGSLDYRFISPSRSKRDPKAPLGAKHEWKCMFRIMITEKGAWSAPMDGWECSKEKLIGPPKCTLAQIWKKALAKKAPTNALATIGYRAWEGVAKWYFSINDTSFSEVFPDDC